MANKLYETIKKYIFKTYFFILLFLIIFIILNFKLPFYFYTHGSLSNLNDKVKVTNGNLSKGSFNLTYVNEIRGSLSTLIFSKFNNNWDMVKEKDILRTNESIEDSLNRSKILLDQSIGNAVSVAYKSANKQFKINTKQTKVILIDKNAKTNLSVGDEILSINNIKINEYSDIEQAINYDIKEQTIEIKNNNKIKIKKAELINYNNKKIIGIQLAEIYDYDVDPKIEVNFESSESGPSGGLMLSLQIYNLLTKEDITKGLVISGTGTISTNGNVGEIGGVEYKIKGACFSKADIFLVPKNNYDDAMEVKKTLDKCKTKIYSVENFNEAVQVLKNQNI